MLLVLPAPVATRPVVPSSLRVSRRSLLGSRPRLPSVPEQVGLGDLPVARRGRCPPPRHSGMAPASEHLARQLYRVLACSLLLTDPSRPDLLRLPGNLLLTRLRLLEADRWD